MATSCVWWWDSVDIHASTMDGPLCGGVPFEFVAPSIDLFSSFSVVFLFPSLLPLFDQMLQT
tara:strand:- start:49 stop:234 length:186 start_codon:yes stop_codon:yes gene_type:complete